MSPLSDEKLAEIIVLAEKLKHANEHKPEVDAEKVTLIHAQAIQHANDHDLAHYVGKELGLEANYVDAALQALHPSREQIIAAKKELGISIDYAFVTQFIKTNEAEFLKLLQDQMKLVEPNSEFIVDGVGLYKIMRSKRKAGFIWKRDIEEHSKTMIACFYNNYGHKRETLSLKIEGSYDHLLVLCKKDIQRFADVCKETGINFELTH